MTVREVAQAIDRADPAVILVSARILHRVIRFDRRLPTLGLNIPHRESYFVPRERLFEFVSRFELEIDTNHTLAETVILLERPDEEELVDRPSSEILYDYWRRLFHVRVHLALEAAIEKKVLTGDAVLERLRHIGSTEYAEIRSVLSREEMLLPPRDDTSTYIEFAAVFLELWYFAREQLAWYFPAIQDVGSILSLLGKDIDHAALFESTRIEGAAEPTPGKAHEMTWSGPDSPEVEIVNVDPLKPSPPSYWRLLARAEKVGSVGNVVKAAILRTKASRQALPDRVKETESLARAELERLARRLRPVLGLTEEECQDWAAALLPLLDHADRGMRSTEARLLYDLQKVCVEHERGVYSLDLLKWAKSLGRIPIRRSLPLLRQVLVTKHLQNAARKLTTSRLSGEARARLSFLIQSAVEQAKQHLRERVRPHIVDVLSEEGLTPRNALERVAFQKIVEELLDQIVERGYSNMGLLRDTLSQNNLKLPDLTSLWELLFGDLLLRIDKRLSEKLDGVHHRGPIYLRMSQRLSAMAFGTAFGRRLTRYVALPVGGAFLILETFLHVYHLLAGHSSSLAPELENAEQLTSSVTPAAQRGSIFDPHTWIVVFPLAVFLGLLINSPRFREWVFSGLWRIGQVAKRVLLDLPASILRWPLVRRLLDSVLYGVFVNYLFKPVAFTAIVLYPYEHRFGEISWGSAAITFLAINLLLNSPLGRYADVLITEQLVRGWRELQMRIFASFVRMVIDLFQLVLTTMEQVLYTVDEWLRFRTGEHLLILAVKVVLGLFWSVITYVVRIYITLLIEPQINPIKHFPVVTVSHKLMLPFSIHLTRLLATPFAPLGKFWANAIAGTTVFLLPGVFGFLVWELKENWRLYASNRPRNLGPIPIGSHSETMARLLRLGFHAGTVPRLFGKLRRAAATAQKTGNWKSVHKHRAALHHVEERLKRFIDRELLALLAESPIWRDVRLSVDNVRLANHYVEIELTRTDTDHEPLRLMFQERGGWIIASLVQRGWLNSLDEPQRETFFRALEGVFKYAGVDLVWDRLLVELRTRWFWYDVNGDGLLIWPERDYEYSVQYKLRDTGVSSTLVPIPREIVEPKPDELERLVFSKSPLPWSEWVETWEFPEEKVEHIDVPQEGRMQV